MAVFFPRSVGPVFIDVVIAERAKSEMEVTKHPVERGAKITDHVWRLSKDLEMECACLDVVGTWRALNDLMNLAEPMTVISGFDIFENMIIEKLEPFRDVSTGRILSINISLTEVIIVSTDEGGNSGTGGDERGAGRADRGQVQALSVDTLVGRGLALASKLPR